VSIWGHRVSAKLVSMAVVFVVIGAVLVAVSRVPEREITLIAKGMAFYLEGDPGTPNPTITVKAGERVRILLRNEDRGFVHDVAVPAVETAVDQVSWNQTSATTFEMPATPGTYQYICQPHQLMMHGTLVVQP
jgi:FtsP/CotA-like multicopper oxidase with cupredoxin domain